MALSKRKKIKTYQAATTEEDVEQAILQIQTQRNNFLQTAAGLAKVVKDEDRTYGLRQLLLGIVKCVNDLGSGDALHDPIKLMKKIFLHDCAAYIMRCKWMYRKQHGVLLIYSDLSTDKSDCQKTYLVDIKRAIENIGSYRFPGEDKMRQAIQELSTIAAHQAAWEALLTGPTISATAKMLKKMKKTEKTEKTEKTAKRKSTLEEDISDEVGQGASKKILLENGRPVSEEKGHESEEDDAMGLNHEEEESFYLDNDMPHRSSLNVFDR